jgi:nucleotide-binding universal stress UspA family protein
MAGPCIVGVDGSVHGLAAAAWAAPVASGLGLELVLVHAKGLLEGGDGHTAAVQPGALVEDGDPVSVLLRVAEDRDASMIVVGRRGSGTRPDLRLGSTSHQLAERAHCPVVIIPTREEAPS